MSHVEGVDEAPTEGRLGVLLIDHGSRRPASHRQLLAIAERLRASFAAESTPPVVAIAHMEIEEPSVARGFAECVRGGARRIVALPCMLSRGRHVSEDIPRLLQEAALGFPDVRYLLAPPLSEHKGFIELLRDAALAAR